MLLDNRLDIALIEGSVASDELVTEPFAQDKLLLILPPDHELTRKNAIFLSDLMHCDLLLREKGSSGRAFLNTVFESQGLTLSPLWESASTQALVRAVAANVGLSILPEKLVQNALSGGLVVTRPIQDAPLLRVCHIVWHRNKYLSPSLLRLIDLAKKGNDGAAAPIPCLRDIIPQTPFSASRRYEPIKHTTRMRVVP